MTERKTKVPFTPEQIAARNAIGEQIRAERLRLGVRQMVIANHYNLSPSCVSQMEVGRPHPIPTDTMHNILAFLKSMKPEEVEAYTEMVEEEDAKKRSEVVPNSVRDRLGKMMRHRKISSVEAGVLLGFSGGYIRNIITGRSIPVGSYQKALENSLTRLEAEDASAPPKKPLPPIPTPPPVVTPPAPVLLRADTPAQPAKKPLEAFSVENPATLASFLRFDGTTKYTFLQKGDGIVVIVG